MDSTGRETDGAASDSGSCDPDGFHSGRSDSGDSDPGRSDSVDPGGPLAAFGRDRDRLCDALADAQRVLITGPPMSGKYGLLHRCLAAGDAGLLIATDRDASRARVDHAEFAGADRELYVLDCVESDRDPASQYVRAASIRNLTQVGVTFTAFADAIETEEIDSAVGLYSLSHLLGYWETAEVLQFTRALADQVVDRGWPFVAVLSGTAHAQDVRHAVHEPFDCIIETRVVDGDRQLRIRDRLEASSEWNGF